MRKFKTESKKLLDLMVNSIYTNHEIFLRELISNASDSLDKLYLRSLTKGDNSITRGELSIHIEPDEDTRTLTISDNGIGMTKDELDKNLGTIAHSGSLEAKEAEEAKELDDVDIIGQFGVGFYSAFMVADKVTVVSKAYDDDEAHQWQSDGNEGYNITDATRDERGTDIILHLRADSDDETFSRFLNRQALKNLVKRYSDYIRYPIHMTIDKTVAKPKPEDAGDDYKTEYETVWEDEILNSMVPIWTRKKSEVSDEEYNDFYKATFHDGNDPLRVISMHAEGTISYDALLFIPKEPPMNLYSKDFKRGLALYSSGVMIQDQCEDLLSESFMFVRGIVDSPDLNLNISREMLQHDRQLHAIERKIEKKVKSELEDMRDNDRETYVEFFAKFGHTFKYSIYTSFGAQSYLLNDLLLYMSAREDKPITLDEYVTAMADEQKDIYFASGDVSKRLGQTPSVKAALGAGCDVLLCPDNIDEFCLMTMGNYEGKNFKNVASEDVDFGSADDKAASEELNTENADLFTDMANTLGEKVTKVVATKRLTDDVASAVVADGPVSLGMEKYFATMPDNADAPKCKHVLELNPNHPVFEKLQQAYADNKVDKMKDYAHLLYGQALLAQGLALGNPTQFNALVLRMLA